LFSDFPAQEKLKALEVEEFFEVVLSAQDEEVQRFKPDPRGLEVVLRELGVEPQDAVYVGDRHSLDGVAAHRAGMDFLIAGDGHPGGVDTYWRLREILLPKKL
jgi:FMN phosphatase YigB (HAD superfamily)